MKRSSAATLLLSASTVFALSAQAQTFSTAPSSKVSMEKQYSEVLAVVERFHAAIKDGDLGLAERVLASDVTIYEQGHREASRAEYLGHHFKQDAAFAKAIPSTIESRAAKVSGDLALVTFESSSAGMYKEKPVRTANLSTYVLAKRGGNWWIVHVHWSARKR